MQFRCEYVGHMGGELDAAARNIDRLAKALETAYREAHEAGELAPPFAPEIAAIETTMFLSGLVRLWILHGRDAAIRRNARSAIAVHMASRRRISVR
jgi:TetR/AcrR family transcriptional regulator, acrAB operon repressor